MFEKSSQAKQNLLLLYPFKKMFSASHVSSWSSFFSLFLSSFFLSFPNPSMIPTSPQHSPLVLALAQWVPMGWSQMVYTGLPTSSGEAWL